MQYKSGSVADLPDDPKRDEYCHIPDANGFQENLKIQKTIMIWQFFNKPNRFSSKLMHCLQQNSKAVLEGKAAVLTVVVTFFEGGGATLGIGMSDLRWI